MFPIEIFTYPNGRKGVGIYKCGYQSTKSICPNSIPHPGLQREPLNRKDILQFNEPLLFPFRDPVKRFISAVDTVKKNKKYDNYNIDDFLDGIEEKGDFRNLHFMESSIILRNACYKFDHIQLYKFPDHYEQMLRDGGYEGDIPHKNKSIKKWTLTKSKEERVRKYYAKDIEVFESIKNPGQPFYWLKI